MPQSAEWPEAYGYLQAQIDHVELLADELDLLSSFWRLRLGGLGASSIRPSGQLPKLDLLLVAPHVDRAAWAVELLPEIARLGFKRHRRSAATPATRAKTIAAIIVPVALVRSVTIRKRRPAAFDVDLGDLARRP
eukprot:8467114-Pyramimonas_sp.AAC.1